MKIILTLLLVLTALFSLIFPMDVAHAKNGNAATVAKTILVHAPEFTTAKGSAKFKFSVREQEFEVEAQVAKKLSGTMSFVTVNDVMVGSMTVNSLGKASLSLSSKLGQSILTGLNFLDHVGC
jgi:hypothetical protein